MLQKEFQQDQLRVRIYGTREEMGAASAAAAIEAIGKLLQSQPEVNVVFGAAPSQNELLAGLVASGLPFERINAYHMDEYIGLPTSAPQLFANFLQQHIWSKAGFKSVHTINPLADPQEECRRYGELLTRAGVDVSLLGIGENGHIAFNDPHMANFADPLPIKVVTLDEHCRRQQVNDGAFAALHEVPERAITLTIPLLLSAKAIVCTVPGPTKRQAVTNALRGELGEWCPATILRRQSNCQLFLDAQSGADFL